MLHRYPFHFFAGFGPRPGSSHGVLLGGTGLVLAAAFLLSGAVYEGAAARPAQATSATAAEAAPDDSRPPVPLEVAFAFRSLASGLAAGQSYAFAAATLPLESPKRQPGPVASQPAPEDPSGSPAYLATLSAMQRSWGTIKYMFR